METQVIVDKIQAQFPQVNITKNTSYGMYRFVEVEWSDEKYFYVSHMDIYADKLKPYGFIKQYTKGDKKADVETIGTHPLLEEIISAVKQIQRTK